MTRDLQNARMLNRILEAKYASRLAAFQRVLERERSLRASLQELAERARETHIATPENMKLIGADVIWQSWIEQKSRHLNLELAQVMVQKEHETHLLRQEFGRKLAGSEVERILADAQGADRAKQRDAVLMTHVAQAIMDKRHI